MLSWIKKIVAFYFISFIIVFVRVAIYPREIPLDVYVGSLGRVLTMNSLILAMGMISIYLILKSFRANNFKISAWSPMEKIGIVIAIIIIFYTNMFFPSVISLIFFFKYYAVILLHTLNLIMMVFGIMLALRNKKEMAVSFLLCSATFLINIFLIPHIVGGFVAVVFPGE